MSEERKAELDRLIKSYDANLSECSTELQCCQRQLSYWNDELRKSRYKVNEANKEIESLEASMSYIKEKHEILHNRLNELRKEAYPQYY